MSDWRIKTEAARRAGLCVACRRERPKHGCVTCAGCIAKAVARRDELADAFRGGPRKTYVCGVCGCAGHNKRSCRWKAVYQ